MGGCGLGMTHPRRTSGWAPRGVVTRGPEQIEEAFTTRWRQNESGSPWCGIFAENLEKTAVYNFYNSTDQVLTISEGATRPWSRSQLYQKPAGSDDLVYLFWLSLKYTWSGEQDIWPQAESTPEHARLVRQWNELAYYFQPVSGPAGAYPLTVPGFANNVNMDYVGGAEGIAAYSSHTYPLTKPYFVVGDLFDQIRMRFHDHQ